MHSLYANSSPLSSRLLLIPEETTFKLFWGVYFHIFTLNVDTVINYFIYYGIIRCIKGLSDLLQGPLDLLQAYDYSFPNAPIFYIQYICFLVLLLRTLYFNLDWLPFRPAAWMSCWEFFSSLFIVGSLFLYLLPLSFLVWRSTSSRTAVLNLFVFRNHSHSWKWLKPPNSFCLSGLYLLILCSKNESLEI